MNCYGYIRVSTDDQANSRENQSDKITEFAEREGIHLAQIFVDEDVSGSIQLRRRPQGKILWDILDPGDTVVFCKPDRVFRSVLDSADTVHIWLQRQVRCVILDLGIDLATPAGRLVFNQMTAFAEFEREMIAQRTREIAAYLKKQGRPYGGARPFGWQKVGTGRDARFEPLDSEREIAFRVLDLKEQGKSYRDIAWILAKDRTVKPGKKWTDTGKGVWYSVSEVHALCQAARLGFPVAPRAALLAAGKQGTPT